MTSSIRVLMLPDYRVNNPYQSLLVNALAQEGVTVEFPHGYRRVFPIFRATLDTSIPYSVVHLHWITPYFKGKFGFIKAIYALKLFIDLALVRLRGIKIVWTVHNQVSHDSAFPRLERWTCTTLSKLANRLVLHSNSMVNSIASEYKVNHSKISIIPHGHYRDIYPVICNKLEARQTLNLPASEYIYLNLGMLRPYKGLENLISAWTEHIVKFPNDILIIAGYPLDKAYGEYLAHLTTHVKNLYLRLEFLQPDQVSLFFTAADLIVLPFQCVLTSGSLLLAMSFGKPVIAPKLGGIPEVLGKAHALLYNPEEPNALIQAMRKSTQIDLEQLSRLTIEECDRLGWAKIAQGTKGVYDSINK